MGEMREKCGVVGVFDPQAAELAAEGIRRLDHRGPDSTGLGGMTEAGVFAETFQMPGRASETLTPERISKLGELGMVAAVAHSRYATSGGADVSYPVEYGAARKRILYGVNGNESNLQKLEADLARRHISTDNMNDGQMEAAAIGHRVQQGASIVEAIADAYPNFVGAHSSVVVGHGLDGEPMVAAFRDPNGIRPLLWGRIPNGGHMFASETVALAAAGASYEGEVDPGELVTVTHEGMQRYQLAEPDPKFDPMEIFYFSNKDSLFKGQRIGDIRAALGRALAAEYGHLDDSAIVVGIPNSAKPFAEGYAHATQIKYVQDALRKHRNERTFLGQDKAARQALRETIYDLREDLILGKPSTIVDDSLARNNTAPPIARKFMNAGAPWVDVLIGSPPIRFPNFYGINTPTQGELVASHMSIEDIRDSIGCRRLGFLSLEGMLKTFYEMTGETGDQFDLSCFTGDYPVSIGERDIRTPVHSGYSA
jgi:amidophosphoribosyltransferase